MVVIPLDDPKRLLDRVIGVLVKSGMMNENAWELKLVAFQVLRAIGVTIPKSQLKHLFK